MSKNSTSSPRNENQRFIRFSVPVERIDSRTLGVTLVETDNILRHIAHHRDPESSISLNVVALRPGSFEIPFELVGQVAMLTQELLPFLSQSFKTMVEFIKLSKELGGWAPKEVRTYGQKIEIVGSNNSVIVTDNVTFSFYKGNPAAREAVRRQFTQLAADDEVNGIEFKDEGGKSLIEIPREEFENLAAEHEKIETQDDIEEEIEATLIIKKVDLSGSPAAWRFVDANGSPLSARMNDKAFLERVLEGEQFAAGDRLHVQQHIRKSYDEALDTHTISGQTIVRVLKHIRRSTQMDMGFDSE